MATSLQRRPMFDEYCYFFLLIVDSFVQFHLVIRSKLRNEIISVGND